MYRKPDPIDFLREDFPVGIHVINFGFRAEVIGYHSLAKMLVVQDVHDGQKWLADPYKCEIVPFQKPVKPSQVKRVWVDPYIVS